MQARIPKKIRTARIEPAVAAPIVTVSLERLGGLVRGAAGTVGSGCRVIELEDTVIELVSVDGLGEFALAQWVKAQRQTTDLWVLVHLKHQ